MEWFDFDFCIDVCGYVWIGFGLSFGIGLVGEFGDD